MRGGNQPHPGSLRHRVDIGYTLNEINENGYPEPRDVVLCRAWAAAAVNGNQHAERADAVSTEQTITFIIRYRPDVCSGMWVRFQNDKWFIHSVTDRSFRRTYLDLNASTQKEISG